MNINKAHRLVKALVGEDDFHDVEDVLASYYDLAQREIATTVCPIKKTCYIDAGTLTKLPEDLYRLIFVDGGYERPDRNHISISGSGKVKITYFAYPKKLYDSSPTGTEFEVDEQAHAAIPYFAAAQTALADSDMKRYYAFMDMYNGILANINAQSFDKSVFRVVRAKEMK